MRGSRADCLVERGRSSTWALDPALPPLPTEGSILRIGPSCIHPIRAPRGIRRRQGSPHLSPELITWATNARRSGVSAMQHRIVSSCGVADAGLRRNSEDKPGHSCEEGGLTHRCPSGPRGRTDWAER